MTLSTHTSGSACPKNTPHFQDPRVWDRSNLLKHRDPLAWSIPGLECSINPKSGGHSKHTWHFNGKAAFGWVTVLSRCSSGILECCWLWPFFPLRFPNPKQCLSHCSLTKHSHLAATSVGICEEQRELWPF